MSPKMNDAYMNQRRDDIINAAFHCFVEKGIGNTTMQDIFKASELSAGAVYNYFNSKEDIIAAASIKSLERNILIFSEAGNQSGENPINNIMDVFLPMIKQEASQKAIGFDLGLYSESTRNPKIAEIVKESSNTLITYLTRIVKQMQENGKYSKTLDARILAQLFIGIFYGVIVSKVIDPDLDIDALTDLIRRVVNTKFEDDSF
jgi:TetR/AcrR family transcriptional regulator, transcriptional repressor of aconitase